MRMLHSFLKIFIYFWLHQVFRCRRKALYLWYSGSVEAVPMLSCPMACGILVPQPGIKSVPPALEDGFLTTRPPGKSLDSFLTRQKICTKLNTATNYLSTNSKVRQNAHGQFPISTYTFLWKTKRAMIHKKTILSLSLSRFLSRTQEPAVP